jgi:uncharacterized protein (UPF0333 family)
MARVFKLLVGVALLVAVVAASVYAIRRWTTRRSASLDTSAASTAMTDMPTNGPTANTPSRLMRGDSS